MNNKIKRAVGIGIRAALVLAILFVIIFKYNDLVNIDVRALVEKTNIHAHITHPRYVTHTRYLLTN